MTDGYTTEDVVQQRKASDIILSLENKIELLTKLVYNQDMLLKIVADKTNKIFSYVNELQKEYKENLIKEQQENNNLEDSKIVMSAAPEHQILEAKEIVGDRRIKRNADVISNQQNIVAIPNKDSKIEKKVPVMQRVSDHTGKDLFMSNVVITDESGAEVHKTKTNAVGKWQAILKPGNYKVAITKTDSTTKKILEGNQDIVVPSNVSSLTLPVVIIKR